MPMRGICQETNRRLLPHERKHRQAQALALSGSAQGHGTLPWLSASGLLIVLAGASVLLPQTSQAANLSRAFPAAKTASLTVDHGPWDRILARHVRAGTNGGPNRVTYRALKANRAPLRAYLGYLQGLDPRKLTRDQQMAYWINLYNAKTVDVVLDHYPVRSIRNIKLGGLFSSGPWKAKVVTVNGKALSLDNIEHDILRPGWKDKRIHYAVNCASHGCPDLARKAYRAKSLNAQLDAAARAYIASPRGVSVTSGKLTLSKIYDWYAGDFGSRAQLRAHLIRYAPAEKARAVKEAGSVRAYVYDWSLNDAR